MFCSACFRHTSAVLILPPAEVLSTRLYFEAAPPAAHHVPYQTGSLPHILLHREIRRAYRKLPLFLRQAGYSLTVH